MSEPRACRFGARFCAIFGVCRIITVLYVCFTVFNLVMRTDPAEVAASEAAIRAYQQANAMQLRADVHKRQVETEKVKEGIRRVAKEWEARANASVREVLDLRCWHLMLHTC